MPAGVMMRTVTLGTPCDGVTRRNNVHTVRTNLSWFDRRVTHFSLCGPRGMRLPGNFVEVVLKVGRAEKQRAHSPQLNVVIVFH